MTAGVRLSWILLFGAILLVAAPTMALAGAGDDSLNEIGTWAIVDYSNARPLEDINCADDIADGFAQFLALRSSYSNLDSRRSNDCKEVHLKDPSFGGNDQYSFDKSDVGMFVGHGPSGTNQGVTSGYLLFNTSVDDQKLWPTEVRWGNYDLDWIYLSTCTYLKDWGNPTQLSRLKYMMAGAHEILGYATLMTEYCASGEYIADRLLGWSTGTPRTFRYSWNEIAEMFQASGKIARTYYGPGCANEYLPGYGAHGPEPDPYPTDAVYIVDYTTS